MQNLNKNYRIYVDLNYRSLSTNSANFSNNIQKRKEKLTEIMNYLNNNKNNSNAYNNAAAAIKKIMTDYSLSGGFQEIERCLKQLQNASSKIKEYNEIYKTLLILQRSTPKDENAEYRLERQINSQISKLNSCINEIGKLLSSVASSK